MAYVFLLAAISAEVIGTSLLKATDGFTLSVTKVIGVGLVIAGVVVLNLGGAH